MFLIFQLQVKHSIAIAEINQLKDKVRRLFFCDLHILVFCVRHGWLDHVSGDASFRRALDDVPASSQLSASEEDKSLQEAKDSALEKKIEDSNEKILKLEGYWLEAQDLCKGLNEQLVETQGQYETLDKKYNKAKKLLKDYQQK